MARSPGLLLEFAPWLSKAAPKHRNGIVGVSEGSVLIPAASVREAHAQFMHCVLRSKPFAECQQRRASHAPDRLSLHLVPTAAGSFVSPSACLRQRWAGPD